MPVFSARSYTAQCLLACVFLFACLPQSAFAVECKVAQASPASDAEQAYLHGDYDRAATLYQQQLLQNPNDPTFTVGLAKTLLKQQNVKAADALVQKALASTPKLTPLLTALAEIQYREGMPWLATTTAGSAAAIDPCYAKLHLFNARLLRLNSYYGTAANELKAAHALDPHDPAIRRLWFESLPPAQRIKELEAYLSAETGDNPEDLLRLRFELENLKKQIEEPRKSCRLVSNTTTTSIDFAPIMHDAAHLEAFGLDAKLNDHNARLQIDTGASGLLITRSVAEHSGLKRFSDETVGGIGSKGERAAYSAYADDIKIGSLEFRDCQVEVIDQRSVLDIDGLIGMDVFSNFLITLDYPLRKLVLGPLPARPGDNTPHSSSLETADSSSDAAAPPAEKASSKSAPTAIMRDPRDRYIAPEMKDWTRIYRVGHNLLIPASLNNTPQKLFILDTGSFSTTISPDVARQVTKVYSEERLTVQGISGKVDKVYTADSVTFKFANLVQKVQDVVSFDTSNLSKDLGLDVSGLIGITALGQTTMSIDYRDGLVKFVYDAHRGYAYPGFH